MTQATGLNNALNAFFFVIFFGLISFSILISYQQLLVDRNYQIFYTEEEADEANIDLYDLVKETLYGTSP